MRSGERLTSIGIPLSDVFDNPEPILKKLLDCHEITGSNLRVLFYNKIHDGVEIEKFLKKYADLVFKLNITITKDLDEVSFFHINHDPSTNPFHRYGYRGDAMSGLKQFIQLMKHINTRAQEGYR